MVLSLESLNVRSTKHGLSLGGIRGFSPILYLWSHGTATVHSPEPPLASFSAWIARQSYPGACSPVGDRCRDAKRFGSKFGDSGWDPNEYTHFIGWLPRLHVIQWGVTNVEA